MGKKLSDVESVIYQEDVDFGTIDYVRGFWDGGYDPGSEFEGVGWYLAYRKSKPAPGALWTRLLTGYGRCYGRSAAEAELQAFQSLLFSFHTFLACGTDPKPLFWDQEQFSCPMQLVDPIVAQIQS